ncbi:MAG: thiamine pyrophosphate-binding protein [Gammaproteobacteria bacterium]|nr:thiamine pyrophosphate-binding protein [Gammaproteobacteria bacterium]
MSISQPMGQLLDKATPVSIEQYEAGDIILRYLKELEVEYVFGLPGGAIEPIFNALARSAASNGPQAIIARHEAGAVFMADGYARESGKLGVCIATSGPGATNMITGVASAYQDRTPILVITGQTPINQFGNQAVQESSCTAIDTVAIFKHCTAYSSLISHPDQLERKLIAAISKAYQHQQPVHLSIPLDIARSKYPTPPNRRLFPPFTHQSTAFDIETANALAEELHASSQPVFVIGEGCKEAISSILTYCEQSGTAMVATPQGKGLINPYHPHFYGVCGLAGHNSAIQLLTSKTTDLIVVIGCMLDQQATYGWQPSDPGSNKTVYIGSNPDHFNHSQYANINVLGNIKSIFEYLNTPKNNIFPIGPRKTTKKTEHKVIPFERRRIDRRKQNTDSIHDKRHEERRKSGILTPLSRNFQLQDELKYLDNDEPLKPQRIMHELSRRAPDNTCFLADIGNSFLWSIHYLNPCYKTSGENSSYLYMGMGFASMAWSIAAAIGVAMASPKKSVICIVGDGSMLMSAHELTVAVQLELAVIYIVLNDQAYGTVKHGQKMAGAEEIGSDLPAVDFALYAKSIGANGIKVTSLDGLNNINLTQLSKRLQPTLIDILIDTTESPPLSGRLEMLASGHK